MLTYHWEMVKGGGGREWRDEGIERGGGNSGDGKHGGVWLASDRLHKCCRVCVLMNLPWLLVLVLVRWGRLRVVLVLVLHRATSRRKDNWCCWRMVASRVHAKDQLDVEHHLKRNRQALIL